MVRHGLAGDRLRRRSTWPRSARFGAFCADLIARGRRAHGARRFRRRARGRARRDVPWRPASAVAVDVEIARCAPTVALFGESGCRILVAVDRRPRPAASEQRPSKGRVSRAGGSGRTRRRHACASATGRAGAGAGRRVAGRRFARAWEATLPAIARADAPSVGRSRRLSWPNVPARVRRMRGRTGVVESCSCDASDSATRRDRRFHEECAVVGIYGHDEAANLAYLGLYAMQHRGQEGSGIVSSNGKALISHRGLGLVADVFHENVIRRLVGDSAIGHNRYSTAGETVLRNTQPLVAEFSLGSLAVCHNGNFVNALETRRRARGATARSSSRPSDTEVLVHLVAGSKRAALIDRVIDALAQVEGAYCVLFLTEDELIAARDPHGFRPLCSGASRTAAGWWRRRPARSTSSRPSTCARSSPARCCTFAATRVHSLQALRARADQRRASSSTSTSRGPTRACSAATSTRVRKEMGRQLARETAAWTPTS